MRGELSNLDAYKQVVAALPYYDEADVRSWWRRHEQMTGHPPRVYAPMIEDLREFRKVPNAPFREPYLWAQKFYATESSRGEPLHITRFRDELLAVRERTGKQVGPERLNSRALTEYLRDNLGLKARMDGKGGLSTAWLLQYEVAEALCKALGLVPRQVGI